jgi:hypothetical protein
MASGVRQRFDAIGAGGRSGMTEAVRPLAIVEGYEGLVATIQDRVIELNVTYDSVDWVAGNKVVAGGTNPIKRLAMASLGPILQSLGLKLLVVEDNAPLI